MVQRNALTVDLEDWYQGAGIDMSEWAGLECRIEDPTRRLLELFADRGVHATFFVLGYVADHNPGLVREIAECGHELGTHGYQHKPYWEYSPAELRTELARSIAVVEDVARRKVIGHRAPFFSITRRSWWALEVLADLGLSYDSSVFPIRHWRCGVHDAPRWEHELQTRCGTLVELPPSTARVPGTNLPMAGGAYLRAWPYALTRRVVERLNAASRPAVVYLHPWELDTDRPWVKSNRAIEIGQRINRGSCWPRLVRLLDEFEFAPIRDVISTPPAAVDPVPELIAA